jgi:uncharacterized protein YecT (DUF1311 family)
MRTVFALLLVVAVLSPAYALARVDSGYESCIEAAGPSDTEMTECVSAETERQDRRLNEAYGKLMNALNSHRKARLRTAQRAWIVFRDAEAAFLDYPSGGTLDRLLGANRYLQMTKDRADELERQLTIAPLHSIVRPQ